MDNNQQAADVGLVVYNNGNSQPTVPLETNHGNTMPLPLPAPTSAVQTVTLSPDTQPARKGDTQRLKSTDFDKKSLPNRIQFLVRESGSILEKAARAPLVIGRRNTTLPVDIDLGEFNAQEMGISRNHFRIEPAPDGKLLVIDLKTVNGTRLNGETLAPMRPYELRHGDEIRAGRIHLKVYFIY